MTQTITTPHIAAKHKSEVAATVLMPGDPLRAKYIADNFLDDVVQFNHIRNMFGYTGTYKNTRISVMASGMGMPSIGIYAFELFKFYDVANIIRLGTCGAYSEELRVLDMVLAKEAWTESSFAKVYNGDDSNLATPDASIQELIKEEAKLLNLPIREVRVNSSDVFYRKNFEVFKQIRDEHKCDVVEMELFALFKIAKDLNKKAAGILTVSDSLVTGEETDPITRSNHLIKMMQLGLDTAVSIARKNI